MSPVRASQPPPATEPPAPDANCSHHGEVTASALPHTPLSSDQRLDGLLHALNSSVIIAVTDRSGTITDVNEAFCRITGYSRLELIGANHRIINSGHHPRHFWIDMWRTIASGSVWRAEVCNRARDGGLYWVDTTIAPVFSTDRAISGFIAARVDITDRKRAEERAEKALAAAQAASRAKSSFLASASHEMRTPLTAILGFAGLLAEPGAVNGANQEIVTHIHRAGSQLLGVVNDVLDIASIESGSMVIESRACNVAPLLRETLETLIPAAAEKGLELRVACESQVIPTFLADPVRFKQVLAKLIGNAIKFTPVGGVTVSVSLSGPPDRPALNLDVEDTGVGMSPEQCARLFAVFTQADSSMSRRFGGIGLGLVISQRLAQLMGGEIRLLRSHPGLGTTFRFQLPLRIAHSGIAPDLHAQEHFHLGGEHRLVGRILLVDDCPDNQRLIAHHLRRAGAVVEIARHGREALDFIERAIHRREPYHMLVTDLQMPEMDGYALASAVRSRSIQHPSARPLPILAITAHASSEDRQQALQAGCNGYLPKPFERAQLLAACQAHLAPDASAA